MKSDLKGFEWDPKKNASNIGKHGISFEEAAELFENPYLKLRSDRPGETRCLAVGRFAARIVAVISTERQDCIRIISARAARSDERETYEDRFGRRT